MKVVYCYRCKKDVAGLEESEFQVLEPLYNSAWNAHRDLGYAVDAVSIRVAMRSSGVFDELKAQHLNITGLELEPSCMVFLHKLSSFGPPCPRCGTLLRTSKAQMCFSCGWNGKTASAVAPAN